MDEDEDERDDAKRYHASSSDTSYGYLLVTQAVMFTPGRCEIHAPGLRIPDASPLVYCAGDMMFWKDSCSTVWNQVSLADNSRVARYDVANLEADIVCAMPFGTTVSKTCVRAFWGDTIPVVNWPPTVIEHGADSIVVFEWQGNVVRRRIISRPEPGEMQGQEAIVEWRVGGHVATIAVDQRHRILVKCIGCRETEIDQATGIQMELSRPFLASPTCACMADGVFVNLEIPMSWITRIDDDTYVGPHALNGKIVKLVVPGSDALMDTTA